jgi:lipopolysaccharide transport system ATP-binding protein
LSDAPAIIFDKVTKNFLPDTMASGFKDLVLHFARRFKEYRERKPFCALNNVSFTVKHGECFGVIGRNGSGKSTTLGMIAGVIRPTRGTITTHGRICPLLELGAGFHPELSGEENIILNGVLLGLTRATVAAKMDEIIAFSGLHDFIHRPLRVYSSGMMARLGFSVAVHLDPEILLVDEVLAVGDEEFQRKCLAKMQEFRERKVTIVFVTHSLGDVERICDRVALLEAGNLVALGEPKEVIAEYHSRTAAGR